MEIGIQTKLSWLCPKTEPFFSGHSHHSQGMAVHVDLLADPAPSSRRTPRRGPCRSGRHQGRWSSSCWTRWRPAAGSRIEPIRETFSVIPTIWTFFWMTRPRFTLPPVSTWAPTSEHRVQAFFIAARSSMLTRLRRHLLPLLVVGDDVGAALEAEGAAAELQHLLGHVAVEALGDRDDRDDRSRSGCRGR
ncbi:MAG: hypothetical protein U0599_28020 [Vicinamibacteria bacterium]